MLNRQKCLVPLAATLLAAPPELFTEDVNKDILLDAWWTNIVYHGSLKGLANSHMAFDSDVRDWLRMMIYEIKNSRKESREKGADVMVELEKRVHPSVEELTSQKTAAENAATFSALAISYPEKGCIDVALATNMVSVGLDVDRLALMVINGQPLTTAEYIQASSRVGRSSIPGVVFINYYRDQTRSLSHYEHFRAYHDAFYRYVEPTSVTPFTKQARNKALHAAIVSVIRHGIDNVNKASCFSEQRSEVQKALEILKRRCAEADGELAEQTRNHIDLLSKEWTLKAEQFAKEKTGFEYYSTDRGFENLLYTSDDKIQGLWQTLQSMRNVESAALLKEILPK
jgi:superfamily II DNA/RNA helicase